MSPEVRPLPSTPVDVLFLYPDRVWPITGGGPARLFALVEHLRAEGLRVGLVTADHGGIYNAAITPRLDRVDFYRARKQVVKRWFHRLPKPMQRVVRRGESFAQKRLRRLRQGESTQPGSFLASKVDGAFNAFASACAEASGARAVIAVFAWSAPALTALPPGVLRLVDTIDVQHQRREKAQAAGYDLPQRACTREEEIAALSHGEVLLAIQAEEGETFRTMLPEKRVIVVEHAVPEQRRQPAPPAARDILYVGNLYPPNVAGAEAFLAEVWPEIRRAVPDARFVVCGKVCEAFAGRDLPGVHLAGVVPSLDVYYQQAAVVVNLVPYGTGLKIKTVEALAHGKCTVVTPAGAEGLRRRPERGLIVCPLADMGPRIVALLQDPATRMAEADAAWAFAQEHLSAHAVYGELRSLLKEHCCR